MTPLRRPCGFARRFQAADWSLVVDSISMHSYVGVKDRYRITGELISMLASILGARLRLHLAAGWVFEPFIIGPDIVEYTLKEGPHAGRHAIQYPHYQRVAPGIETTAWYEESGTLVHLTWYLDKGTVHRFAALPAWLAEDMTVYRGDNQDPAFLETMTTLRSQRQDWPRRILSDEGYFVVL